MISISDTKYSTVKTYWGGWAGFQTRPLRGDDTWDEV